MKQPIFISYSRHDKEIVFPFVKRINEEFNTVCWIDYNGIESGSQFEDVIINAIEEAEVVLFMLSDNSIASEWTRREVLYAADEGKRIIPVILDGGKPRKWFRFHFGNIDSVNVENKEHCNKLFNNLAEWIGSPRIIRGVNSELKLPHNITPQIVFSPDKNTITISILGGVDLVLKKDVERDCYIGEIPVKKIISSIKNVGDIKEKSVELSSILLAGTFASLGGMISPVLGLTTAGVGAVMKYVKGKMPEKGFQICDSIISELNNRYDIHLSKTRGQMSDFSVELGISDVQKLEKRFVL